MTDRLPRTREQRKTDTLAKLSAPAMDVWVATAAADANADERVVVTAINSYGTGAAAALAQGRGNALGTRLVAISDDHDRAGLGQNRRNARTDTTGAARDDCHFSCEVEGIG